MTTQTRPAVIADLKPGDFVRFNDRFGRVSAGRLVEICDHLLSAPIWKIDTERRGSARFVKRWRCDIVERCPEAADLWRDDHSQESLTFIAEGSTRRKQILSKFFEQK